ncbi:uncharacterized protein IL334_004955 [Kwoniella shivajii]|uniref:Mus7/MMS22 family-domain-containing protein n=1 Tax=Kwoniella shivajii TaxID=564305 RepID=A0ABZ1D256_9TREE|nr:hypothetical protein IL334_004955 [Kwoniella shivajii]
MPPRAGPSRARPRGGRASFIPSTQYQAGPSSRSEREESEDPLALTPLKDNDRRRAESLSDNVRNSSPRVLYSTPILSKSTIGRRRGTRSSNIRSSSPAAGPSTQIPSSTSRITRASKRRERGHEELGEEDLVPPSEDGEYEDWMESRRIGLDKGKAKAMDQDLIHDTGDDDFSEVGEAQGSIKPKKPDKKSFKLFSPKHFESLLPSPVPPTSPQSSIASSITDTRSRETSPTQPMSFSQQDDLFYPAFEGNQYFERQEENDRNEAEYNFDENQASVEKEYILVEERLSQEQLASSPYSYKSPTPRTISLLVSQDGKSETFFPQPQADIQPSPPRSSTPHTVPLSLTQEQVFKTLPSETMLEEKEDVETVDNPRRKSSTPQTIPFLPIQDEGFQTLLPVLGISEDMGAAFRVAYPEKVTSATSSPPLQFPFQDHPITPMLSHPLGDISPKEIAGPVRDDQFPSTSPQDQDITFTQDHFASPSKRGVLIRRLSSASALSPILAAVSEDPVGQHPIPTPLPADQALEQFRGVRTFRTRTVLQLQPYTKERQIYEAALKKGGLKKGKKAVAPSKEITQEEDEEDEARISDSSEASAAEEPPERIVIGNTPPPKKHREPKKLIDADFDEYFFEHGSPADEHDPDHMRDLQKIARRRIRMQKEERLRSRQAEKENKEFERLMRDMRGEKESSDEEGSSKADQNLAKPRPAVPRPSTRTPGGTKTYGSKSKALRQPILPPLNSHESALPSDSNPLVSPAKSHSNTPTASFRTAFSGLGDVDMDIGYGQPQESFHRDVAGDDPQSPSLQHLKSFIISDIHRSHSPPHVHDLVSDSDSVSSSTVQDRRQRIARRMMPAAMLRQLEAEAEAKDRRRAEKKRRERKTTISPIKPGRAVVRRRGGQGDIDDINELFEDNDADVISQQTPTMVLDPSIPNSFDEPMLVPDGNTSSEAEEDNQAEQTLARLHRGDFEGIVAGNRWKMKESKRKEGISRLKVRPDHSRRPALGLAKRVRAPISEENRAMVQSRLDFPFIDKSPTSSFTKKRKRYPQKGQRQRPAIRLDDHVIFATADFEFSSQDEVQDRPSTKPKVNPANRIFARTQSANVAHANPLDAGVGKARSWANFDRFPIDFDITPLPSGIYCYQTSIPGSGKLEKLVEDMRSVQTVESIDVCIEHGLELRPDMSPSSIQAIVPLLFDGVLRQMVVIANEELTEGLDISFFAFLGKYSAAHQSDIEETTTALTSDIEDALRHLNTKLDNLDIGQSKKGQRALLDLRWAAFELSCRLQTHEIRGMESLIQTCSVTLLRQLLSLGFDKTIRCLKQIMRGESDSAEVNDTSVTLWISLIHALNAWDNRQKISLGQTFVIALEQALDSVFHADQTGPIAAERIWFLVFGLCALSQFGVDGKISSIFNTFPRWLLVRRAAALIKVAFHEDAEKKAHPDQLRGRDKYIKVMMARCVRLSAVWKWSFDRESFSVATRNLGIIFKDRQYRNLPTEPPVDYPDFITRFDMSLTAAEDTKRETAFELYIRLVCVAASDIISSAQTLSEAQQAEKDVQRLVMSIIPVSSVKFNRIFPPSPKDLGQLINRYSTMIAACYFSPSLLDYLLANSKKWSVFEQADFDSRQICIRGLMYLSVARRHHTQPLQPVVNRLAEIMRILQSELEILTGPSAQTMGIGPSKLEIERTMVLLVTCFRQMIIHHSFDMEEQKKAVYPDPCLLHQSWTIHIFDLELAKDPKCGLEVVATIQTFLNARASALPQLARSRREAKESHSESLDEYGSLGIDFTDADVLALGGEIENEDEEVDKQDQEFAAIIENVISPKIYRLLSDMLPPVSEDEPSKQDHSADRQVFISKLTKCWSDCASVLVVEHQRLDWSTFISPFGRQSWARLGDERGRVQVGLHFMSNVAILDPAAFTHHEEDFVALFFQVIGTDKLTVEHKYLSALLLTPGAMDHPLLSPLAGLEALEREMSRDGFMGMRTEALKAIFAAVPDLLRSSRTPPSTKSFVYRCINLFVSSLISYDKSIDINKVIHKQSYRAFTDTIVRELKSIAGEFITQLSVPGLKHFGT